MNGKTKEEVPIKASLLNVGLGERDPITIGVHCAPECTYLETDKVHMCCGICRLDNIPLDYYDWYLAHCKI